ncbi:hypothetical protein TL16_g02876 [Triparma laevis f. inornata]|uniref:PPM-type phosphatase domain-containing protein n=1 Tax=Triparma laevis f. inornata TaxID=1714386 RepID=A0A9W6ZYI1_9STRA|nr:hypothetical protein TL16_g02876 [Triparma laevis f. inornata]
MGSNRRSAPSHYQRSISQVNPDDAAAGPQEGSRELSRRASPFFNPYCCLIFTTSEDEDDRPLLSGCINRHKVFWSNSFFHITSEKGGGEGGTRVYRPLDEFMGGGKRVMKTPTGWSVSPGIGVKVPTSRLLPSRSLHPTSLSTHPTHIWSLTPSTIFTAGNTVFTVVGEGPLVLRQKGSLEEGGEKEVVVEGGEEAYVVGRSGEADLTVTDRELSRFHFAITTSTTPPILTDLHSTNGTYLLTSSPTSTPLTPTSEFVVGRTGFKVSRYEWGGCEKQGSRRSMEDKTVYEDWLVTRECVNNDIVRMVLSCVTVSAVFDGHGGGECSEYLEGRFVERIRRGIGECEGVGEIWKAVERRERSGDFEEDIFYGKVPGDESSAPIRELLKTAFLDLDNTFISDPNGPAAGSTCASAIMFGNRLFAANVGDSRVVLCRQGGNVIEMTNDHKPTRPDEAQRVRDAGGFILHKRVMGELAISRAFGDKGFKTGVRGMLGGESSSDSEDGKISGTPMDEEMSSQPLVIAEPEITEILTDPMGDEFILLACDGLFDVFSSSDAVGFARNLLLQQKGDPAAVSSMLANEAINVRRSRDNVSVIIIVLRPFWED